jgi:serine/threonine protein kinase/tetratricopeptide (TPR) repeat protein
MLEAASNSLDFRLSLAQEFKVLSSLRHPHIVNVLDYGFDEQRLPFVAMEFVSDARSMVEAAQNEPLTRQIQLITQLLQALAYLHRRGILHRDLKPGNVLVRSDWNVKVLDFGLALEPGQVREIAGTIAYMAPEIMLESEPTPAADLYSVGVMAYEILAGRYPFRAASTAQLVVEIVNSSPDLTQIEPALDRVLPDPDAQTIGVEALRAVIGRLLVKTSEERYATAESVIEELNGAIGLQVPEESEAIRESFLQAAAFVGREAELGQLTAALKDILRTESPVGSAWLVSGESGVGKTRLIEELRTRAMVDGVLVVRGQAVAEGGLPFQLWRDPLRRLLLTTEISDLDAGILKDVIPDIEAILQRSIPDATVVEDTDYKQRLTGTVVSLFQRQTSPALLLLEDLQWSSESLDLLRSLLNIVSTLPLLIVGNFRSEERPTLPDELPGMQVMRLERFGRDSIAVLCEAMLGDAGRQPELIELVRRETEGNVFFVVEVVRALAEEAGRLGDIGQRALPEQVSAGGMERIIERRLERVPKEDRALLDLAAVAGRELDLKMLEAVIAALRSAFGSADLESWLINTSNRGVLEIVDGRWRFAHDKLRQAVLGQVSKAGRRRLHRAVAEAIESVYPDQREQYPVLFTHWHQAGDAAKEYFYARHAGEFAIYSGAFLDAIRYFERALELMPSTADSSGPADEAYLLIRLGEARENSGDYEAATQHLERALRLCREVEDRHGMVLALNTLADVGWRQSNYAEATRLCEESLAISGVINFQSGLARAHNRLGIVSFEQGDYVTATRHLDQSMTIARASGDQPLVATAANNLGLIAFAQGDYPSAKGYFEETLRLARSSGEKRKIAMSVMNIGVVTGELGDYETATRNFQEMLTICRAIGEKRGISLALRNLGGLAEYQRDYAAATFYYEDSLALARASGERKSVAATLVKLGHVARIQDAHEAASAYYREAIGIASEIDAVPTILEGVGGIAPLNPDRTQAVQWLGLVLNHPAMFDNIRHDITPILDQLRQDLTEAEVETALAEGQTLELSSVVEDILQTLKL